METGEVFAWLVFMIVITLLFFAAFGQSNITEDTIEDYMENIMEKIKSGER
jgi:outer membrane lipoprotein-sorting protein|tara:strand:+ start:103 stop:255 length:153 start_codon:yes stop_codon:yes gene_type:complete